MGGSDTVFFFRWWFSFFVFGVISFPTTYLFFRKFVDAGYAFSKTLGFLTVTYLVFLFSTLKVLPFTKTSIFFFLLAFAAFNLYILFKKRREFLALVRRKLKIIIFQEIFFTLGLIFWSMVRGYQPDINGLEKFMDFGFINSILRSTYLPPADMWFAGESINYYWFGHFLTALATKISGVPSEVTYNLMLATILGLTLTGIFTLVATLFEKTAIKFKKTALIAGIVSSLLVTFGGNFHTPFYALKNGKENYWYPDATRFIGYNPETNDKTIHEFPLYSFVVSDLHAHLINLPVVLLYISLLYKTLALEKKRNYLKKIIPLGFLLGIMFMTSTWDFGNYLLLTGISVVIFYLITKKNSLGKIFSSGVFIGGIILTGLITSIPFIFSFTSIAKGIDFVKARTPLWQLGILWGFPGVLSFIFSLLILKIRKIKKSDLFILSLLLSSWLLIIIPEIFYVKDIYIASHHRANTMFKLTYQAFVMFYTTSGYIALRYILSMKGAIKKIGSAIFFTIIFASILWYPKFAIKSYYHDLKGYVGLSGSIWLKERNPDIYNAISWFNKNVSGQPVILEAPGDSYTEYNVISSYTGLPTISGWFVHEWLWRGEATFPQKRVSDITEIYTSQDIELTKSLLDKYKVKYVIIGSFEREKFPNLWENKFNNLGKQVFSSGNLVIYQIN